MTGVASIPTQLRQRLYKSVVVASRGQRTLDSKRSKCAGSSPMKPLWAQTLAWIAAALAAFLLALANPDGLGFSSEHQPFTPHGAVAPR
jgi:hypothetical protein